MIERMKLLSITGPKDDIDRVVDMYLSRYEIHLENTLSELKTVKDLRSYIETDPYKEELLEAEELMESYHKLLSEHTDRRLRSGDAMQPVHSPDKGLKEPMGKESVLANQRNGLQASKDKVVPSTRLNYSVKETLEFRLIKFRFGRISKEHYEKFSAYVYDTIDTTMFKCEGDGDYVRVVYSVPEKLADRIDTIYTSMHFERSFLLDEYEGTPVEAGYVLDSRISAFRKRIDEADQAIMEPISNRKDDLVAAYHVIRTFSTNFDARKMVAITKYDLHNSHTLCGWMTQKDAANFQRGIERDSNTFYIIGDDHNNIMSRPPIKMRNPGLFRSSEMYVEIYGLPSYNELDPTILIRIIYSILFGFMSGDTGQGLCLLTGRFLLYRFKRMRLVGTISCCGIFSTIFGFLFDSVFGSGDITDAAWLKPQKAMVDLPFIGKLNTVFVVTVAIGMGVVLVCMVLNTINSTRAHDTEKTYFNTNGAAGLVFYFALSCVIILYMTGNTLPATAILVATLLIPPLIMFFKEPLTTVIEKESEKIEGGMGMFIIQGTSELSEVLLSYFSSTLSLVGVGAFAVSRTAMTQVVLMLVGAEAGESTNWAVVIGGNLFVCGMEGLIVGIQVLRLECCELLGRFYRRGGCAFESYGKVAGEQQYSIKLEQPGNRPF